MRRDRVRRWVKVTTSSIVLLLALSACDPGLPAVPARDGSTDRTHSIPSPSRSAASGRTFSVTARNSYSVQLTWNPPIGSQMIEIHRESRLIDRIGVEATSYTDYLLWPRTGYTYTISFRDGSGTVVDKDSATITTPSQSGSFPRLYSPTSFWNTPIPPNPVIDRDSAAIISLSIARFSSSANLVNSATYGFPIAYADPASMKHEIGCTQYDCETAVSFRIPSYARAKSGSDGHLIVIDPSTQQELDMFRAKCCWTASSRYLTAANGWGAICPLGHHCNGAVAAGFAAAGGLIRPEEIAQGHIDHALVMATPYTRFQYVACPATHSDGEYSYTAIPLGARIQLDPTLNVDAQRWSPWQKVIAKALQVYGAYIADTSGSLAVRAEGSQNRGYDAWAKVGVVSADLSSIPWSRFRLLKLTQC
jgi:hypothetical protein